MHPLLAGIGAAAAMSVVMRASQRLRLLRRPPPATITERALELPSSRVEPATGLVNSAAHLAYGAALALPFAAIRSRITLRTRVPLAGMAYGLAVYGANYEALLPALKLMPPAHRDDRERVGAMIAAHLVYGSVLELLVAGRRPSQRCFTSSRFKRIARFAVPSGASLSKREAHRQFNSSLPVTWPASTHA